MTLEQKREMLVFAEKVKDFLKENPEMATEIEAKIREHTIAKLVSAESGVSDAEPVVQELSD